jgi:hypothetical protein
MSGSDDEFDEFLARKRPLFRRPGDDDVEPPHDIDRLVLRQARDAIKPSQPERLYRGPGWGVPLAVAATLLVCLSMVLHVVMPKKAAPESPTQRIAHEVEVAPATGTTDASAGNFDATPNNPPVPLTANRGAVTTSAADSSAAASAPAAAAAAPPASAAPAARAAAAASPAASPAAERVAQSADTPWRGDARSWRAEIERLRAEGKTSEADAELALYKRQHRAYASSPDR